jgi:hypothetical protein
MRLYPTLPRFGVPPLSYVSAGVRDASRLIDPRNPPRHQGVSASLYGRPPSQVLNCLCADTTGWAFGTAGCWVSKSPSGYVTIFGEASVPTPGLEGGVGCNPRMTFDGKVRNLGPCVLKLDSPLPEEPPLQHPLDSRLSPSTLQTRRGLRLDLRHQCLPRVEAG